MGKYSGGSPGTFDCKDYVTIKIGNGCRYTRGVSLVEGNTKKFGGG